MNRWIPTGCLSLDKVLEGGLPPGQITLIYGEAETGKSSLAMQCAVNTARMGYKTFFIDSDGAFSVERLTQIASTSFEEIADSVVLVRPSIFDEQDAIIDDLDKYLRKGFGLVVVDTVTSLYRSELKDRKETFRLNRGLNRQVAELAQIAKSLGISVLILSQVRGVFESGTINARPVAARVLKFWANAVINLSRTEQRNQIRAIIEKGEGKSKNIILLLTIDKEGVHDTVDQ